MSEDVKKSILLVSTDSFLAEALERRLSGKKSQVKTLFTCKEAERKTKVGEYDLILLVHSFKQEGEEDVFRFIDSYSKKTPFILLTETEDPSTIKACSRKDIRCFLRPHVGLGEIVDTVRELLNN